LVVDKQLKKEKKSGKSLKWGAMWILLLVLLCYLGAPMKKCLLSPPFEHNFVSNEVVFFYLLLLVKSVAAAVTIPV
jgi:hypothetical protein